eukprot:10398871-Alexandrium_andersonii.AAC.1
MWRIHTQDIEGTNSQIKIISSLAPHISFPLLSARITIKKFLATLGAVDAAGSFERRESFVQTCISHHAEAR